MLIIIDRRLPEKARQSLSRYGELVGLATEGITYDSISGHPDIFFCQNSNELITAPNLPKHFTELLRSKGVCLTTGTNPVGKMYPATARYNGVLSEGNLIHHLALTDPVILSQVEPQKRIHVSQGYCRCNLLLLKDRSFITSDTGIYQTLAGKGYHGLFIDPSGILLPGFSHGFIGGTCGTCSNQVFFIGSLHCHKQGNDIRTFLQDLECEIAELYDGPLFDGGGIMFIG